MDLLKIGTRSFESRLIIGTGKYGSFEETGHAIQESGAEIVTVAIRRTNLGQNSSEANLLDFIDLDHTTLLPNTAGCYTSDEAIRTLRLARELLDGHDLVKLEVLGDPQTLFPNVSETLVAAEQLVKDGFQVMVYTSLIGSGMVILNPWNLSIIIENLKVPVIVDAGVGTASDAVIAMELGCDAVLMNTAIAAAQDPIMMARAMKNAVQAGRDAFRAGRMPKNLYHASPSSPTAGMMPPSSKK
jgi:thiazole synthase